MSRIYVALDLETTGLSAERDAIIEIGAVKFRDEQVLDTWSSLVNPRRPIPYKVRQLTGIAQAEADQAPPLAVVVKSLLRFAQDHPIVGHNVSFDLGFLRRHNLFVDRLAIDTFELASILMPHATRYSLGMLAEALGISVGNKHRALDDAKLTTELFRALFRRATELDLSTVQEINRLAARSDWPLRHVFRDVERAKARAAFGGSIGQQLMAKGALDGEGSFGLLSGGEERERPLKSVAERKPLDVAALCAMLEEGGLFARHFPGYEYRPQQVEMLRLVAEAINDGQHLMVEAGTGTGKGLAYLLPAIHWAVRNGERVVVSTNTINLQDQLYKKDVPDVRRILPLDFKATVLKGRSNYICLRKLATFRHGGHLSTDELRMLVKILAWLPSTVTGDQGELFMPTAQERAMWARVASESETCLAERCSYRHQGKCFFYQARRQAESAHLIIVNHALLLSDVAVENRVLPDYRYLIVDEAHHLEDSTTRQLSFSVDQFQLQRVLTELSQPVGVRRHAGFLTELLSRCRAGVPAPVYRELEDYATQLRREVEAAQQELYHLFNTLESFLQEHRDGNTQYDARIRLTSGLRIQPAWTDVEIAWDNFSSHLFKLHDGLERLYGGLGDLEAYDVADHEGLLQSALNYAHRIKALREQTNALIAEPSSSGIYWAEVSARDGRISLHAAPLHVGELVQKHLFMPKECVILTSATLCTNGDFNFMRERLGAWEAREATVGSPFDYASSTLLYLVDDIPEPNQPYYQKMAAQGVLELCRATRGRALVLFTSYSQLRSTARAITRPLAEEDIVIFEQGDGSSRRQLLESFRTTPRAVLLGTRSFWEGIDVVGQALSCLVIARLPFSVPSDPIFAARAETFDEPFGQFSVPETILRFRQGFGRLIRTRTDRGVVVVLDKRLLTKSYGRAFLNSLPECTVRRGPLSALPAAAARWIDGKETRQPRLL